MDVGQCQGSFLREAGSGRKGYLLGMGDGGVYSVERTTRAVPSGKLLGRAEAERSLPLASAAWAGS